MSGGEVHEFERESLFLDGPRRVPHLLVHLVRPGLRPVSDWEKDLTHSQKSNRSKETTAASLARGEHAPHHKHTHKPDRKYIYPPTAYIFPPPGNACRPRVCIFSKHTVQCTAAVEGRLATLPSMNVAAYSPSCIRPAHLSWCPHLPPFPRSSLSHRLQRGPPPNMSSDRSGCGRRS